MLRYFVKWVIGGLFLSCWHNSLTAQRLNYLFSPSLRNRITNIVMSSGNTKNIVPCAKPQPVKKTHPNDSEVAATTNIANDEAVAANDKITIILIRLRIFVYLRKNKRLKSTITTKMTYKKAA